MVSTFRNVLDFFNELGIYDVVLPFLLVFTMIFAILEKTKIFGTEKLSDGNQYSRKSLNAMVSFTSAFFVIASSKAVEIINQTLAHFFILLLMAVLFLMLFGTFYGQEENFWSDLGKKRIWIGAAFGIGIILIFLNAVGWLEPAWDYLMDHWDSNAVASIILMIVVIGFMAYIVSGPSGGDKKDKKD